MKHPKFVPLVAWIASLTISGCGTTFNGKPTLNDISELQNDELILVGRVELVPPLSKEEQYLQTLTSKRFQGKVSVLFSDTLFDDLNNLPATANSHSTTVDIGSEFYARQPNSITLFYSGGIILTRSVQSGNETIKLPGGIKYTLNNNDRAVYVGTLRYHRDDYNTITKVEVVNDFKRANEHFRKQFGNKYKLRSLIVSK